MKRISLISVLLIMVFLSPFAVSGGEASGSDPVIAMCRPTIDQIKNIVIMKEAGLFGNSGIRLLCVYHEKELTGYEAARQYVRDKKLAWIAFAELKGKVAAEKLFGQNRWTSQFREIFETAGGIIFTGGMDIPPAIYSEENSLLTEATTPYRTLYETSFLFHLIGGSRNNDFPSFLDEKPDYPVLGICLGAQTMNIAAGGSLFQDIPSEIYGLRTVEKVLKMDSERIHSSRYLKAMFPGDNEIISPAFHRVRLTGQSVILKQMLTGLEGYPMVLSSHHQSVKKVGKGLFVAAVSMDGKIIEALEHEKYKNVLGVQFHPEYRHLHSGLQFFTSDPEKGDFFSLKHFLKKNTPSTVFHRNLWRWFVSNIQR